MRLFWLFMLVVLLPVQAAQTIHRWVDSNGIVHFSDQATAVQSAETIQVSVPAPSSTPSPQNSGDAATNNQAEGSSTSPINLALTSPLENETIRANNGSIPFSVTLTPAPSQPYQLEVLLDGATVLTLNNQLSGTLNDVARGMHQIIVKAVDGNGKLLASSKPTTFYLFRVSVVTLPKK